MEKDILHDLEEATAWGAEGRQSQIFVALGSACTMQWGVVSSLPAGAIDAG